MKALLQRAFAALLLSSVFLAAPARAVDTNSVLVLYDGTGGFAWYGNLHAKMLGNLMGHFNLTPVIQPVESYTNGQISQYRAVFYCGDTFDNPLPAAFTNDVSTTTNPVCWIKNNLWQVSGNVFFPKPLDARIGFRVVTLDGLNPDFTINTNLTTAIVYKGESFSKNKADPTLGLIELVDTNIAVVPAVAWRTNNNTTNTYSVPYIVHGGNFWYVSDSPFDYMSEDDRYLVFADLLHDVLLINHPETHTAIIRLEDIAPEVYQPGELTACTDYLKSNNVPFAMAVIPNYKDPLGYYNNNIPLEHNLSDNGDAVARAMLGELRHAVTNGGQVIMHGFTHQYDSVNNPSTGVSADDFEFWRELFFTNSIELEHYEPVPEDSLPWVSNRIQSGLAILNAVGLTPLAWEPPHYAASDLDYRYFATNFNLTMQRKLYFSDDYTPANRHIAGQFFPFFIERDIYGERIMPENLGNYEPDPLAPAVARTPAEIVNAAKKNLVIRDGWANAFFHGLYDPTNLHQIVEGVKALGYTYVQLVPTGAPVLLTQPVGVTNKLAGSSFNISVGVVGAAPLQYQWSLNGTPVVGATNSVLNFSPSTTNQAGNYQCIVTNAAGAVTSSIVNVDIGTAPSFTAQPLSQTNVLGFAVNFSVTLGGTAPFSYQWRMNGTNLVGETNATLAIPASTMDMTNALFSVVVSNRYGAATSANALLFLHLPPIITGQPISQTVLISNNLFFGVFHIGDAPVHYQWYFNTNTAIINATNDTVSIIGARVANNGTFTVVLTNAYGAVTSAPALLTVVAAPLFTNQPASQSVFLGSNATFSAAVLGAPPMTLQWQHAGTNLSGATTNTLTLTNVQPANLGDYVLVAANSFGTTTSAVATLTANAPPFITNQPAALTVSDGSNATFTVGVTGTAPFAYQWRFNTTNILAGATNATLALTNVTVTNGGNYDVVVTNNFGSVTSSVAALTVLTSPTFLTQPVSQTNALGSNATFTVSVVGTAPFSYQWRFNGTNLAGANTNTLQLNNLAVSNAGNYDVVVTNVNGAVTSAVATLTVVQSPVITGGPLSRTNLLGSVATFSVTNTGTAPFHYQWYRNGSLITNANFTSIILSNVGFGSAASFFVVITNNYGSVTSATAVLTIVQAPIITNQPVSLTTNAGSAAIFGVSGIGGTAPFTYQWRFNGTNLAGANTNTLALANVQFTNQGNYDVVVSNAYAGVTSSVAVLTVNAAPTITASPLSQNLGIHSNASFTVTATGSAPLTYLWRFNGTNLTAANTNSLTLTDLAVSNAGNYDVVVTNAFGAATSAVAVLTVSLPPTISTNPAPLALTVTSNATFSVGVDGTAPFSYQWRFNGTNLAGANTNTYTVINSQPTNAGNYDVVVANNFGTVTSAVAALTVNFPPVVTTNPAPLTVLVTSNATFAVTVSGTAPFTYQWRFNGTPLAGSNTNAFTVANAQPTNAGNYDVIVANGFGTVTSAPALLTVGVPPTITNAPTAQSVVAGQAATFSVFASGSEPLNYQWWLNNTNLVTGGTNSSLTLSNASALDAALYSVVVGNPYGTVTSAPVALTVNFPAAITTNPAPVTVLQGGSAAFSVAVTGTAPLAYQWRLNGAPLAGANTNTFTVNNAQATNGGSYDVVVSNPYGTVTSAVAVLTVNVPATITSQPVSVGTLITSNATFTVAATGSPVLAYQWRFNGAPISGANTNTLTVVNVQPTNTGDYDVIVSNPYGTVTSAVATLTVNVPVFIVTPPASQTNLTGASATFTVAVGGAAPFGYQWRFNGTAVLGATTNALTVGGLTASNAGSYDVVVTNLFGAVTSAPAVLTVVSAPAITTNPAPLAVLITSNATFSVAATGTAPLAYQWRFNGADVSGATTSSLTIANAQPTNAGNYDVVVSNPYGTVTSTVAALTVNVPVFLTAGPAAQTNFLGSNATFTVTVGGTAPFGYQWRFNGTNLAGANTDTLVVAGLTALNAGNYDVVVTNGFGALTSAPAALTVVSLPVITGQPASRTNLTGTTATFTVTNVGTAPFTYQWYRNGSLITNANTSAIVLNNVTTNAAANFFVVVANAYGSVTSAVATLSIALPPVLTGPTSRTNNAGTTATFSVNTTGTGPFTYQWRFNGTNLSGATATNLALANVQPTNAGTYDVVVTSPYTNVTSAPAVLTVFFAPVVSAPPVSRTNTAGSTATFTVTATALPLPAYQWKFNSTNIPGATNATLTLPNVQSTNAGTYTVLVANLVGSASPTATLTVTASAPPVLTLLPNGGANNLGFNSDAGISYTVEYRDSLTGGSWQTLTNVTGTGGALNLNLSTPVNARFYRVRTP